MQINLSKCYTISDVSGDAIICSGLRSQIRKYSLPECYLESDHDDFSIFEKARRWWLTYSLSQQFLAQPLECISSRTHYIPATPL